MEETNCVLSPTCYDRHSEFKNHINEGKFWRGVIITIAMSSIGIFTVQYNMAVENNNRIIILTSKLSVIAEANIKRLDRLEDMLFSLRGVRGQTGATGNTGETGERGSRGPIGERGLSA